MGSSNLIFSIAQTAGLPWPKVLPWVLLTVAITLWVLQLRPTWDGHCRPISIIHDLLQPSDPSRSYATMTGYCKVLTSSAQAQNQHIDEAFPTHFPIHHLALWWLLRKPSPSVPHPVTWCHTQIHKSRGGSTQRRCQARRKKEREEGIRES